MYRAEPLFSRASLSNVRTWLHTATPFVSCPVIGTVSPVALANRPPLVTGQIDHSERHRMLIADSCYSDLLTCRAGRGRRATPFDSSSARPSRKGW
jgi:hypothetical protein